MSRTAEDVPVAARRRLEDARLKQATYQTMADEAKMAEFALWDELHGYPDGLTYEQIAAVTGWSKQWIRLGVKAHKVATGDE